MHVMCHLCLIQLVAGVSYMVGQTENMCLLVARVSYLGGSNWKHVFARGLVHSLCCLFY